MKTDFRMIVAVSILCNAISPAYADLNDIGTQYSKNAILVDLAQNGQLIRFSYCEDKAVSSTCEMLGKGFYKVDELNRFKTIQKWKMAGNGIGAVGGLVSGFIVGIIGGATSAAGVGVPIAATGVGLMIGGWKLGSNFSKNYDNISALSDSALEDKQVNLDLYTDQLDADIVELNKKPNTLENRKKMSLLIQRRAQAAYRSVYQEAKTIEAILLRVNAAQKF